MWSIAYAPIVLLLLSGSVSLLWGRYWLPHTPLGALHNWLGVKTLEQSSKFPRGRTISESGPYLRYTPLWTFKSFLVGKADDLPPGFFQNKSTGEVLATLSQRFMGPAVDLDDYLIFDNRKIYYSVETKEWVLGSIRLSQLGYFALQGGFGGGWVRVQTGPVAKEHLPSFREGLPDNIRTGGDQVGVDSVDRPDPSLELESIARRYAHKILRTGGYFFDLG